MTKVVYDDDFSDYFILILINISFLSANLYFSFLQQRLIYSTNFYAHIAYNSEDVILSVINNAKVVLLFAF